MRYVELFAGAGGMSLGLERAGLTCVAHAELADFPRRVLAHHWPDVPLYGDVSLIDGRALVTEHGAIDLLAGGSPCQDMSVAGKRAGLAGARSGLFYEQIRLWEETQAPHLLWENVAGALSSNQGADFAAVLSAIVGGTVPVPSDGWRGAGVVSGPTGVAAWRLLDAQWFGVPQRRLRVFVFGSRAGGVDPAAVLLEPEGVRGHPPTRGEAGEGPARDAGAGVAFALRGREDGAQAEISSGVTNALRGASGGSSRDMVLSFGWQNAAEQGDDVSQGSVAPLRTTTTPAVLAMSETGAGWWTEGEPLSTLRADPGGMPAHVLCATGEVTHALTHEGFDASEDGTGRGTPIVANAVCAREAKGWNPASSVGNGPVSNGIPRRLMPVECERLMGWPDGWTDVPDEKGKPASDAVRYKACGNGVVSACSQWIGERLLQVAA